MSRWEYCETELWRHGEGKFSLYHCFGAAAIGSVVLVFAEAREGTAEDAGCPHDIILSRSTDGGKTFGSPTSILSGANGHCWTNPTVIHDEQTKRTFMLVADNHENLYTDNYILFSDDCGLTWSEPVQMNHWLEPNEKGFRFHLPGPGHGIQLKKGPYAGRLLVNFWHRYEITKPSQERCYCSTKLYSDDHGLTWHQTGFFGEKEGLGEVREVELRDGRLIYVARGFGTRYLSESTDGGETWSDPRSLPAANTISCDGGAVGVCGHQGYEDMVLVSRVSEGAHRWNMEILISLDGGHTFPDKMSLPVGDAMPGYSDLCVIEEEEPIIGLIHCRYNHVLFSRISLQTLTAGRYEHTSRNVWLW